MVVKVLEFCNIVICFFKKYYRNIYIIHHIIYNDIIYIYRKKF